MFNYESEEDESNPGEPYVSGVEAYVQRTGSTKGFEESLPDDEHKNAFLRALEFFKRKIEGYTQKKH